MFWIDVWQSAGKKAGDIMTGYGILCVAGELKGKEIKLAPSEKLVIGRNPKEANLVFRDITISRKHCLIEPGEDGNYYVTDYSSCGVITGEGEQLIKDKRTKLAGGTVLLIGKSGTKVRLE